MERESNSFVLESKNQPVIRVFAIRGLWGVLANVSAITSTTSSLIAHSSVNEGVSGTYCTAIQALREQGSCRSVRAERGWTANSPSHEFKAHLRRGWKHETEIHPSGEIFHGLDSILR